MNFIVAVDNNYAIGNPPRWEGRCPSVVLTTIELLILKCLLPTHRLLLAQLFRMG